MLFSLLTMAMRAETPPILSHPPLRVPVTKSDRPMADGPAYFVDAAKGSDEADGSRDQPWKTIQSALTRLKPGDTLYLREGVYFENVICSMAGEKGKPITVRAYPGERVILDGSLPEFQRTPGTAWRKGEAPGEYVSARTYPNLRDVVGIFADSNVGLQTYWYREDLISQNELKADTPELAKSVFTYCGPGMFYDKMTGRIHVRLAPTHQNREPLQDYRGESDPSKVPLAIAPFRSTPLHVDQGMHLRFQDLIIRGGGYRTVRLDFAVDLEFDYVTVFGGTYGIHSKGSGPVRITNCGIYGQIPPWSYMSDNALHTPGPQGYAPFGESSDSRGRNISRLPSHALLVTEGAEESDVFYYPFNNRWEISRSEFADGHDGVYLTGRDMWMHHCWIDSMQDDATYISSPTPGISDEVHLSRNYISKCKTAFGAHTRGGPEGNIYLYGNVVDMRHLIADTRPSAEKPGGRVIHGAAMFTPHGARFLHVENITFAYNTAMLPGIRGAYAGRSYLAVSADTVRNSFNSLYVYLDKIPGAFSSRKSAVEATKGMRTDLGPDSRPPKGPINMDGNLHWFAGVSKEEGEAWLDRIRHSSKSEMNVNEFGRELWDKHGIFADPEFVRFSPDPETRLDPRLNASSPARKLAVPFPGEKHLRGDVIGPAAGAWQAGLPDLRVGIGGRIQAGDRFSLKNSRP